MYAAIQSSFRRQAAPAPAPATTPMTLLSFPGKVPQGFVEDASAAEKDGDLEAFMRSRRLVALSFSEKRPGRADVRGELRAYLRELDAVAPRFDAAVRRVLDWHLCFTWHDAGSTRGGRRMHASLETERAVALFALAAEEAQAAAGEDRRGADGIRRACAALCDAAGALRAASEGGHALSAKSGQLRHVSEACMAAFETLMLAQALECYFELAVAGGKPPGLCAKVAQQVSLDYDRVNRSITPPDHHQIDKSWPPHVQAKAAYFRGEACLRSAQALLESGDGVGVGEAIARLRQGLATLESAKGAVKKAAAPVHDAARRLRKEMEAELAAAERDNCRIYYARVPAAAALAELPGLPQPLVRPTPVETILTRGADDDAVGERAS